MLKPENEPQQPTFACGSDGKLFEEILLASLRNDWSPTSDREAIIDARRSQDSPKKSNYISFSTAASLSRSLASAIRPYISSASGEVRYCGLFLTPSPSLIISIQACILLGAPYIPFEPEFSEARTKALLKALKPVCMITEPSLWRTQRNQWLEGVAEVIIFVDDHGSVLLPINDTGIVSLGSSIPVSHHLLYALSTSGTTGEPKPIQATYECVLSNVRQLTRTFNPQATDRWLLSSPASFDPAMIDIFCSLSTGSSLVVVDRATKAMPSQLATVMAEHRVSILQCTPSLIKRFSCQLFCQVADYLRIIALGGEHYVHPPSLCSRLKERWERKQLRIFNLYGITEVSVWASCAEITPELWNAGGLNAVRTLVPMDDTDVELRSPDNTIWIGSRSGVRKCLLGNENFSSDVVFRCSGDEGQSHIEADGNRTSVLLLGRSENKVKINGKMVLLDDLELMFSRIQNVAACSILLAQCGTDSYLAAFVKLSSTHSSPEAVKIRVRQEMLRVVGDRTLVPSVIIALPDIPLTLNGKVDKRSLLQLLSESTKRSVATPTSREECVSILSEVWSDFILKQLDPSERISDSVKRLRPPSASDYFILEGGSSLDALVVATRIASHLKLRNSLLTRLIELTLNAPFAESADFVYHSLLQSPLQVGEPSSDSSFHFAKRVALPQLGLPSAVITRGAHARLLNLDWSDKGPTASVNWKVSLGECVDASPLVVERKDPKSTTLYVGSHSRFVVALDCDRAGDVIWWCRLPDRIESSAACTSDGKLIIVGCYDGCVYALRADNGTIASSYNTGAEVKCSPLVFRNQIWIGSYDGFLYVLAVPSLSLVARVHLEGPIYSSPMVDRYGRVYCASHSGKLFCFNSDSVMPIWTWATPAGAPGSARAPLISSPAIDYRTGSICIGSANGCAYMIGPDGQLVWERSLGMSISASPCVAQLKSVCLFAAGNRVFLLHCTTGDTIATATVSTSAAFSLVVPSSVSSPLGELFCLSATDGAVLFLKTSDAAVVCSFQLPAQTFSSPVVWNNNIAIGCRDDCIYSLTLA